jgi:hypothetical protein
MNGTAQSFYLLLAVIYLERSISIPQGSYFMVHIFITYGMKSNKGKLYVRINLCIREERSRKYSTVAPSHFWTQKYACTTACYITKGKHKCLMRTCVSQVSLNSTTWDLLKLATSAASLRFSFSVYQFEMSVPL